MHFVSFGIISIYKSGRN